MQRRAGIRLGLVATLAFLAVGLGTLLIFPAPRLTVRAIELDGRLVTGHHDQQVSPTPRLVVALDQPIEPAAWRVWFDGRPLHAQGGRATPLLELMLPGPLPLGSRHTLHLVAGTLNRELVLQVVSPLRVIMSMRMVNLGVDRLATVDVTVHFLKPVADRALAQGLLGVTGDPSYSWRDDTTLNAQTSLPLGSHAVATLDPGVTAQDGSYTTRRKTMTLDVPATVTEISRDRLVQMYYVNTPDGRDAFFNHLDQIDMVSPAWYNANADGSLTGSARQDIIDAAHSHRVQVVPLVVNTDVDPNVAHAILADPNRRAALAANLVSEARTLGYAGWQIDFEQVPWTDRDLLTALVQDCARALHAAGLSLSVAVIPRLRGDDTAAGCSSITSTNGPAPMTSRRWLEPLTFSPS